MCESDKILFGTRPGVCANPMLVHKCAKPTGWCKSVRIRQSFQAAPKLHEVQDWRVLECLLEFMGILEFARAGGVSWSSCWRREIA